jgi:hypothetical protein
MNKTDYEYRFTCTVDDEEIVILGIDSLGRFFIRGKKIAIDEKEAIRVFHALRDYAVLVTPRENHNDI